MLSTELHASGPRTVIRRKNIYLIKLQDPEADAKITMRDLSHHRLGLDGTDFGWYSSALSHEEAIKVAGLAKPTAKLRS